MPHLLRRAVSATGLGLLFILAGCGVTQQSPPTDYFTISNDAAGEFSLPQPVRIARVRVPDYIDNDRLWVRTQEQQMAHLRGARWAEALGPAITRELSSSLGIGLVENPNWPLLLVTIDRLEARWTESDDAVLLVARWALEGDNRVSSPVGGQIRLQEPVANRSASAVARATSTLVSQMNRTIGEELIAHFQAEQNASATQR